MTTPITITDPTKVFLTKEYLTKNTRYPAYYGTLWKIRMQVRASDVAQSLTGATIVMTITDGTNTATRKTGVTSTGASAAQIVIDADQTTENTTLYTGKGWFEIRADAIAADVTFFSALAGRTTPFDVSIKFADAITQQVLCEGTIELPRPKTTFPIT